MTTEPVSSVSEKVYAYITQGDQLLVFRHVNSPDAGIQVPGGTVNSGECLREAVLREAFEETGADGLFIVSELGDAWYVTTEKGKPGELHHRHYFHLRCVNPLPATWRHEERFPSDGSPPILFEFSWAPISTAPDILIAGMGELRHRVQIEASPSTTFGS